MPHLIVKLWPGKSEQQKNRLAEAITKNVMDILHYGEESVSVAMEEIKPQDWLEKVYKPEVKNNGALFTRNPVTTRATFDLGATGAWKERKMKLLVIMLIALCVFGSLGSRRQQGASKAGVSPSDSGQDLQSIIITRGGSRQPGNGPAEHFTGSVKIEPLFPARAPSRMIGASVTFQPGARTAWHSHPLGQILILTAGTGRVQQWGGSIEEIRKGDVVWTPPGIKHWHGAAPNTAMTHTAIQEDLNGKVVEWMQKVSDEQYNKR